MDTDGIYRRLAKALDDLPNGFPTTESGIEIEILRWMYTPEQAAIAGLLTTAPETEPQIAALLEATGRQVPDLGVALKEMRKRGLIWPVPGAEGAMSYRLAPFVVGAYESQREIMDHKLAHLVEEYFNQGGLAGLMRQPAVHRVVPAHGAVKSEWVLPYDDVRALLIEAQAFRLVDCICRKQRRLVEKGCDYPVRMCLSFLPVSVPAGPYTVSREEALAVLDQAEEIGLVHTVSNVAKGVNYVCNCCGCCCGILRGITQYGVKDSVAHANYRAAVDADACTGCGVCTTRCQVGAIALNNDGIAVVDPERCIGCGLCVTGCTEEAATLHLKPEEEIVHPPADFGTWEAERIRRREEAQAKGKTA
ncbi:MAG: 4Fe-4S binding protein [Bacillota bacterium]